MNDKYMEQYIEIQGMASDIRSQCDDLRQMADEIVDKIRDMTIDYIIASKKAERLTHCEDIFAEEFIPDYLGWVSAFEDLRRYIEENELNI